MAPDGTIALAIEKGGDGEGGLGIEVLSGAGEVVWGRSIPETLIFGLGRADDETLIAFGHDLATNKLALQGYTPDGDPTWTRTHEARSIGPMQTCPDGRLVLPLHGTDMLGAALFDGSGNLLELRTHVTDGEVETTAAMCTSDGDIIIVGRVTPDPRSG